VLIAALVVGMIGLFLFFPRRSWFAAPDRNSFVRGQPVAVWIKQLKSRDPILREQAASALDESPHKNAALVEAMMMAAHDDKANVRLLAIHALGTIEEDHAGVEEIVIEALRDENRVVRIQAVRGLENVHFRGEVSMKALIGALKDEDFIIRMMALSAIKKRGPEAREAAPAVREELKTRYLRDRAQDTLRAIAPDEIADQTKPSDPQRGTSRSQ
jgi:hypothetical protein